MEAGDGRQETGLHSNPIRPHLTIEIERSTKSYTGAQ